MAAFLVGGALALAWAGPSARSRRWAASTSAVAMAFHSPESIGIVGVLGASLVCGELSWRLVEAPCQGLRRRFAAVVGHPIVEGPGDRMPVLELPVPVPVAER